MAWFACIGSESIPDEEEVVEEEEEEDVVLDESVRIGEPAVSLDEVPLN